MKRFKPKSIVLRLLALGLGLFLSSNNIYEPDKSFDDSGSFFLASNPGPRAIGDVIKKKINEAADSIDMQIYTLSDKSLLKTINQKSKTVNIAMYYDAKACPTLNTKLSPSVKTTLYSKHGLMHRKICVIDEKLSLFGSSNFTTSSLYWHYNLLCGVKSEKLAIFLKKGEKGSCDFEMGTAFLLPDYKNNALNAVIDSLDRADNTIHLAMFSLTHPVILKALIAAKERGVAIYLYIDNINLKNIDPNVSLLLKKCDKIFRQTNASLLHHKFCFIDKKILIMGSANWTKSGFKKNEEVLVIFDKIKQELLDYMPLVIDKLECELKEYKLDIEAA